jgi:hypothetical protein
LIVLQAIAHQLEKPMKDLSDQIQKARADLRRAVDAMPSCHKRDLPHDSGIYILVHKRDNRRVYFVGSSVDLHNFWKGRCDPSKYGLKLHWKPTTDWNNFRSREAEAAFWVGVLSPIATHLDQCCPARAPAPTSDHAVAIVVPFSDVTPIVD